MKDKKKKKLISKKYRKNIPVKEKGLKRSTKSFFIFSYHLSSSIMHYSPCAQGSSSKSNCHIAINEILDCLSLSKQNIKEMGKQFIPGSLQGLQEKKMRC